MFRLDAIYDLQPPFTLRIVPIGIPVNLNKSNNRSVVVETISPVQGIPVEAINASGLNVPTLKDGNHGGVLTVFKDEYLVHNERKYNEKCVCFETPQQFIAHFSRLDCNQLSFYKDEAIECSSLFVLIETLANIVGYGLLIKHLHINELSFDVEMERIKAGYGNNATPLVTGSGVVRRTVRMGHTHNGPYNSTYVIRSGMEAPYYVQRMILIGDFLLTAERPVVLHPLDNCPVCSSPLVEMNNEWNCTSSDCQPFLEVFLNSIARQTGISVATLTDQYKREEKFHYGCLGTIEEQAREEIPVDMVRTYHDILQKEGFHAILERFFGRHSHQWLCSKASAIDEMFFKNLTYGDATMLEVDPIRPVVYYPPRNKKPKILLIGGFDGLSEQTLELKFNEIGIGTTAVVQEADMVIAGRINTDEDFYHYIKEVSNILIIETAGDIHSVFDLMKYF